MISPAPLISPFGEVLNIAEEFQVDPEVLEEMRKREEQRRIEAEVQRKIAEAQSRPEDQDYLYRLDKKTIVASEQEYQYCVAKGIPMKTVKYSHAVHVLDETKAAHQGKIKKRKSRKTASASRKRNR